MRDAFIAELVAQAESDDKVVLLVGDLGWSVVEPFAERFPDRFFNAGVAEQNMLGLAAGLASEGCRVFAYSIANFPTFRCAEQLRNDVDHHVLPVTIVAVGGGLAYGNLGYSHHAVQDYGLVRMLPNMLIAAPGDPQEVRACMRYLADTPGPAYLRLGKAGEPSLHAAPPRVSPGEWLTLREGDGSGRSFLCTGTTLAATLRRVEADPLLSGHAVHSLPLWGARHKARQLDQLAAWRAIVSVEDHYADCGFGSWLLEAKNAAGIDTRVTVEALTPPPAHPLLPSLPEGAPTCP